MTMYYNFIRGDCAAVYECMLAHADGISVADISRETGLDPGRAKGCVMRLANSGKVKAVAKNAKPTIWKITGFATR